MGKQKTENRSELYDTFCYQLRANVLYVVVYI